MTALIGITDSVPAHETGRAVHAHVANYLDHAHKRQHAVTVRIGTVG